VSGAQVHISRRHLEACGLLPATTSALDWTALAEQLATKVFKKYHVLSLDSAEMV